MAVVSRPLGSTRDRSWWHAYKFTPLFVVVTFALALLAASVLIQHAAAWGQDRIDDLRYGVPRSARVSGVLLPGDTPAAATQIITFNINGQISILVLPAGDTSRLQVLNGPYIVGRDGANAVAVPALRDVNGDGRADLIVTVRGESIIYLTKDGALHLITPEERARLVGVDGGP